ncbi:MAG TPA: NAD(P)/FAD-dependent oxidoreductase [Verrucomicrobiae bacterium]|nr:NAD(P)/FAD-dependent oxidoreductase [Verrucomicrobiae bacterium]
MNTNGKHVVVLGAGFGGLTFCQKFHHANTHVTIVDRNNHHLFQPLLYQVASAGLSGPDIAQPIRAILSKRCDIDVLMEEVVDINLAERQVVLSKDILTYDYLVLALGSVTSYFGHPEWELYAPGLKSLDDAFRIRRKILLAFEHADDETDPQRQQELMTIVVVGGGPTGVELAGTFAELARFVLRRDFRHIDPSRARIILVEGSPRVLSNFPEHLSDKAAEQLKKLGVEVLTGVRVQNIGERCVQLPDREIRAANIIWAAGVSATPLTNKMAVELDRAGRIKVNPDLSIPGYANVFAIGDMALCMQPDGKPVPGVSPSAMQEARHVARIIEDELDGKNGKRPAFLYWDKGTMATIGRSAAVAQIKKLQLSGWIAWMMWLVVHLLFLVGFRNKLSVLIQWTYSYLTYKRGARIITGVDDSEHQPPKCEPVQPALAPNG